MKKIIFVLMAASLAFSCNDGSRSSERDDNDGLETEETLEPTEESDTSSTWDQDRDRNHAEDAIDTDESGASSDTTSTWDRDRDNLDKTDNNRDSIH